MVGDFNNKPLYKQDEGENYLYYQNKTWLVGPKLNVSHAGAHSGDGSSCIRHIRVDIIVTVVLIDGQDAGRRF